MSEIVSSLKREYKALKKQMRLVESTLGRFGAVAGRRRRKARKARKAKKAAAEPTARKKSKKRKGNGAGASASASSLSLEEKRAAARKAREAAEGAATGD